MHLEVEQKFPLSHPPAVRALLGRLGAAFSPPIQQADTYFRHPTRDFAQTDEALRLRRVGETNLITYKGPKLDAQTKTRREIELALAPGQVAFEQFSELLTAVGFTPVLTVRKRREPGEIAWQGQSIQIALDEVEGLGSFLELEIAANANTVDAARSAVLSLGSHLGLLEVERRSYLELIVLAAGLNVDG
jgi:adenylate cyclase class 2